MSHSSDDHDDDDLQSQIWTLTVLLSSFPLFWMGHYWVALGFVSIAVLYRILGSDLLVRRIPKDEQLQIQYNIWSAADVLNDVQRQQTATSLRQQQEEADATKEELDRFRMAVLAALAALVRKYNKLQQDTQQQHPGKNDCSKQDLPLLCQQIVYIGLSKFGDKDDEVVAASFALLALVATSEVVRERHLQHADTNGLDVVVLCMTRALERAKEYRHPKDELESAELQRKACLMLGALSNGNDEMGRQVVSEGGLQAMLAALSWYRYHEQLANWALWAVFIICCGNPTNKAAVVELGGVPLVLQAMKNNPDSIEVARHGIAIIFDLLREQDGQLDIWKIRNVALTAGLHQVILLAMNQVSADSTGVDIMMMGREILAGTGYTDGPIPEPTTALS
jgi:hypothetical protein